MKGISPGCQENDRFLLGHGPVYKTVRVWQGTRKTVRRWCEENCVNVNVCEELSHDSCNLSQARVSALLIN